MLLTPSMKTIGSVIVACLFALSSTISCSNDQASQTQPSNESVIDRELSGPITLTSEWLELNPKEPLKVARDTQELELFPDPPIKMVDDPTGKDVIIPADGRNATIEAELIGSNGVTYHSRPGYEQSMTGDLYITRHSVGFKDLPNDVTYTKVRIKSSVPYPVKKILWRCYNWGEVHH